MNWLQWLLLNKRIVIDKRRSAKSHLDSWVWHTKWHTKPHAIHQESWDWLNTRERTTGLCTILHSTSRLNKLKTIKRTLQAVHVRSLKSKLTRQQWHTTLRVKVLERGLCLRAVALSRQNVKRIIQIFPISILVPSFSSGFSHCRQRKDLFVEPRWLPKPLPRLVLIVSITITKYS